MPDITPKDGEERIARPAPADPLPTPKNDPRTPADEAVGQILGRYKLLEKLGEGGWGVVYMAEQTEPVRRQVALKIIKLGMDTREIIARFEAERQALAMMDHPNIAKVLDAGATASGRPFFVMELVQGERLTTYCDNNHLTTRERLDLFIQVCNAIQHAHQKGIIHRDIKPSNILINEHDGAISIKVIDFGIAKAVEQRLTDKTLFTIADSLIGTPAYMSPEQADPTCRDIDTRSDIYSLGVLLYELLTGKTPFDPQSMVLNGITSIRHTICDLEPLRPSARLANLKGPIREETARKHGADVTQLLKLIRGDLDWIAMKCLEKDRARRYDTANGLAMDIKRHLDDEPVVAGPPSAAYAVKKFVARHKWPVALATVIALLTVAGLVGTIFGLERATASRAQADENAAHANQLAVEAKKAEIAALRKAYSTSMLSASDAIEHSQIDAARHYLDSAPPQLRGWEWRHLSSRLDLATHVHERPRSAAAQIHFLPNGQSYYDVDSDPTPAIRRFDIETGKLLDSIPLGPSPMRSWLNTEANQMVMLMSNTVDTTETIERWDLRTGLRISTCPFPTLPSVRVAAAPDGSRIAYQDTNYLYIFDPLSGATRSIATHATSLSAGRAWALCFQDDGRRVAICTSLEAASLYEIDSLRRLGTMEPHGNSIQCMAFSHDSRFLATGSLDNTIRITDFSVNPPTTVATLRGNAGWVMGLSFSPDGTLLASSAQDRTLRLWDTRAWQPVGVFESEGNSPDFLPNGQTVVNSNLKGVQFWDVRSSGAWILRGHKSYVYPVLLSPDGATIYSGGWDGYVGQPGSLRIWDAATGDQIAATGSATSYVRTATLSRDGSRLAVAFTPVNPAKEGSHIDIMDTATGTTITSLTKMSENAAPLSINSLAFDPPAQNLVWIDDLFGKALLVDAQTGAVKKSRPALRDPTVESRVAWSPDGATIAYCQVFDPDLVLLDAKSLGLIRHWPHGHFRKVNSLTFSPDSRRILTSSEDGIVRVWDAATGARLHDLVGHGSQVLCAVYSPDGKRIATGGRDNNARIWDAETFEQVARFSGHQDYIYSLAWSDDSQRLVSSSGDFTLRIWDTQPLQGRVQARRDRQEILKQVQPLVQRLFAESSDPAHVVEALKSDESLTPRARQIALQVVLQTSLNQQNLTGKDQPAKP